MLSCRIRANCSTVSLFGFVAHSVSNVKLVAAEAEVAVVTMVVVVAAFIVFKGIATLKVKRFTGTPLMAAGYGRYHSSGMWECESSSNR